MHGARLSLAAVLCAGLATAALAQKPVTLSDDVRRFVAVDAQRVVLSHVRVIDGKGNPAVEDRNVVFEDGVGYDPARLLESVRGRYGQY